MSADESYVASGPAGFATAYGPATPGASGEPLLTAASTPAAGASLFLAASGLTPGATAFVYLTDAAAIPPIDLPGIGSVNVGGNVLGLFTVAVGPAGTAVVELPVGATVPAGLSVFAQGFGTDGVAGNLVSATAGLELVTQ